MTGVLVSSYPGRSASRNGSNPAISSRPSGTTRNPVPPWSEFGSRISRWMSVVTGASVSPCTSTAARGTTASRNSEGKVGADLRGPTLVDEETRVAPGLRRGDPVARHLLRRDDRTLLLPPTKHLEERARRAPLPARGAGRRQGPSPGGPASHGTRFALVVHARRRPPGAHVRPSPSDDHHRVESGPEDVVDELPALGARKRQEPVVPDVDVVPTAAREDERGGGAVDAEIPEEEVVDERDEPRLHELELAGVVEALRAPEVVRVEVEDEVGAEPLLRRHRRLRRAAVVRGRVVDVARGLTPQEPNELLRRAQRGVPAHHRLGGEREHGELAAGEP